MASITTTSSKLLVAYLIFHISGGPAMTEASLYPGVGYFQYFLTESISWAHAIEFCEMLDSQLAVPNSEAEAEVYKEIIAGTEALYQDTVFIGFHDLFVNGDYETIHDYPVSKSGYTQWALGAPKVDPNLRCGGFSKNGGLVNLNCTGETNAIFICEQPLWVDYEFYADLGYYKLHTNRKSWPDAWQTCRDEDSHLAVINSIEEHQALQEIFARHPKFPESSNDTFAWVGVHALFGYEEFRTVVDTSLEEAGYSTWDTNYPDEDVLNSNPYVALARNNGSLVAKTTRSSYLGFFCEHEL